MKLKLFFTVLLIIILAGCNANHGRAGSNKLLSALCNDNCKDRKNLACKLTSPELQQRKATVIASLKRQLLETKELENGFAFKFNGSDKMIDELTEFAKSERQCCDFFTFNISISGDTSIVWMELTGPKEAKEFVRTEMNL